MYDKIVSTFFKLIIPFVFNIVGYVYFIMLYNNTKCGIQIRYDEYNAFDDYENDEYEYDWCDVIPFKFIPEEYNVVVFILQSLGIIISGSYIIFEYPWNNPVSDLIKFSPFVIITAVVYMKTLINWIEAFSLKDDYKKEFKSRYNAWKL